MYIYSISNKNNPKEIYIGKTNNITQRFYSHKCCIVNGNKGKKYEWMRNVGLENLEVKKVFEYDDKDKTDYEKIFIQQYKNEGYLVQNEQLNDYHVKRTKRFDKREEVWQMYQDKDISRREICDFFGISDSLLSKIIIEHGGTVRKGKLFGRYEEIQEKIMAGVPIKQIAREYGVADNSITNINKGITAYNPELDYPLNKYVKDEIIRNSRFKPKV